MRDAGWQEGGKENYLTTDEHGFTRMWREESARRGIGERRKI
jgi:hypothetical protein